MRAVIYARVSSDPKGQGRSVEQQIDECQRDVERHGWTLTRVFVDNDRSASRHAKKQRPQYRQLSEYVKAGQADVLVTWEASRFQRDLEDYVKLRALCHRNGVLWAYNGKTFDLDRTDDRFSTGLDALLAERESDQTRDRILRDVRDNARKGRPHGKVPYGYRRTYDPATGSLTSQDIDEEQAAVIREAARRILAGETCNAIARDYNARRIPTPKNGAWDLTRIKRLVTNPTNAGKRVYHGEVISDATWPAILDEATFRRCVVRLSDPARKTTSDHAVKYLLSGIATCGVCGRPMKVMPQRAGYKAYWCRQFCVARKLAWVDDAIERLILARMSQPDAAAMFASDDADTSEVLDEIADKRAKLDEWYDAAAKGDVTPAALGRIEASILNDIKSLESKVRRYDVPTAMYDLAEAPMTTWNLWTLEQKREAIRFLLKIRILPAKRGSRTFDPRTVDARWRRGPEGTPTARA